MERDEDMTGRPGQGGPQDGPIGMASDPHQIGEGAEREPDELRDDVGVGGQRHPGGSSRDPDAQGRRTKEEKHG